MKEERFFINGIPTVVYGGEEERVFIFLHGQGGNKEEAARFAQTAEKYGYQVLGVDLPEHGARNDGAKLLPWVVVPELRAVMEYARIRWAHVSVRAISIGAWFSMLAFNGEAIERCLFSSPLLDMENMIGNMMRWAGVTEAQLEAAREIPAASGQTLSWDYLCWVRQNPAYALCRTAILYAAGDELIPRCVIDAFTAANDCVLTVYDGGQHWLHTAEELDFMRRWEEAELEKPLTGSDGVEKS